MSLARNAAEQAELADAKDKKAIAFDARLGFIETADDRLSLFLPIATLAKTSATP